jgi:6-pyruvoyl-tetrahydropterin synthase
LGKTELGLGKAELESGKTEPELGCEIGLQEEAKPTLVERFKEEWTEVVLLRNMTHREVISFVQEHMICQFGVPQTLTTDQGTSFMSHQFREFMESMKIKLLNSSPYYAQANVQAEAINKVLMRIIKKRIKDNQRRWHEKLSAALWVHRTSRHEATKVTPFELVYGQEAVLPVEIGLQSLRVTGQGSLSAKEYHEWMMDKIDDVPESRFKALEEIEKEKIEIAKAYNKCVMENLFQVGDLVWKTILPSGTQSGKFGKWLPRWEGPFRVIQVMPRNAYFVEDPEGHSLPKALNRKSLKHYYPSMW